MCPTAINQVPKPQIITFAMKIMNPGLDERLSWKEIDESENQTSKTLNNEVTRSRIILELYEACIISSSQAWKHPIKVFVSEIASAIIAVNVCWGGFQPSGFFSQLCIFWVYRFDTCLKKAMIRLKIKRHNSMNTKWTLFVCINNLIYFRIVVAAWGASVVCSRTCAYNFV